MFICGTSALCFSTKFITDIKRIYIFLLCNIGTFLFAKYYSGDQLKKGGLDAECGTYGGEEKLMQSLVRKTES